jgi:hypothetical protein
MTGRAWTKRWPLLAKKVSLEILERLYVYVQETLWEHILACVGACVDVLERLVQHELRQEYHEHQRVQKEEV